MVWNPVQLAEKPIPRSESTHEGVGCPVCQAPAGQPCTSPTCETWDYDDLK